MEEDRSDDGERMFVGITWKGYGETKSAVPDSDKEGGHNGHLRGRRSPSDLSITEREQTQFPRRSINRVDLHVLYQDHKFTQI